MSPLKANLPQTMFKYSPIRQPRAHSPFASPRIHLYNIQSRINLLGEDYRQSPFEIKQSNYQFGESPSMALENIN